MWWINICLHNELCRRLPSYFYYYYYSAVQMTRMLLWNGTVSTMGEKIYIFVEIEEFNFIRRWSNCAFYSAHKNVQFPNRKTYGCVGIRLWMEGGGGARGLGFCIYSRGQGEKARRDAFSYSIYISVYTFNS